MAEQSTSPADRLPLRAWRVARVLSIRELAAAAGVSTRTLQDVEQGCGTPRYRTMRKIAAALKVAPDVVEEFHAALTTYGSNAKRNETEKTA